MSPVQNETSISISWELYQHLTNLRNSPSDSYDAVIRRSLNLKELRKKMEDIHYSYKGTKFPAGTEIRDITHKNRKAEVTAKGFLYNEVIYKSPSGLASKIRGYSVNGYACLEVKQSRQWIHIREYIEKQNR